MSDHKAPASKRATLQVLPVTVSQLLAASEVSHGTFVMSDQELNQVSVVGIIRGVAPFATYIQYSVDDMTGPPLKVKLWIHSEDCVFTLLSPGHYVKVLGTIRSFEGERSLLAMYVRHIKDLNEITSHMMEVVHSQLGLLGKTWDVNMNTTSSSVSGAVGGNQHGSIPKGLSQTHILVWQVIRNFSTRSVGISLLELRAQLHYLSMADIRTTLARLVNEGHVFNTIDEQHFKSAD
ncbi:replication protein A 32 kDa subunit-like [Nelusetta ayraudi]|uniref:replication protein A 32 kDa subunit-like n=1 Tax=Nelusetta ayraudi TaxID=303726 RepID=UPI003F6EEB70